MDNGEKSVFRKIVISFFEFVGSMLNRRMQDIDLSNKVVVITGACSVIGETLAKNFFNRGCRLVLVGVNIDKLENIKDSLVSKESLCSSELPMLIPCDFSELENIEICAKKILDLCGHIDILINNANVHFMGEILNTSLCTDIEIMNINYFSQMVFTKAILNRMLSNLSGHIIFISSSQGICTDPLYSAFGASQHALLSFANSLRNELQYKNIKISSICLPKVLISPYDDQISDNNLHYTEKRIPNIAVTEVISAIENKKNEIIIEPFYRKLSFFIKDMWPNFHFKFFRSKF